MTVTRDQELWAMAFWVAREQGEEAQRFIAERVLRFESEVDEGSKHLWLDVVRRFIQLRSACERSAK
jgi:hypothetical protein